MLEDQLKEMIEKLDIILNENVDVADYEWYRSIEIAQEKLKEALNILENDKYSD